MLCTQVRGQRRTAGLHGPGARHMPFHRNLQQAVPPGVRLQRAQAQPGGPDMTGRIQGLLATPTMENLQ